MKRKSTAPLSRAMYPSRLMPRPRTTFRMDVVVDGHLILSQAKKNEESKRQNIVAERRVRRERTRLPHIRGHFRGHSLSTRGIELRGRIASHLRYHKTNRSTREKCSS